MLGDALNCMGMGKSIVKMEPVKGRHPEWVMVVTSICAYPSKVFDIIDGWVTDTPALVEVVEGVWVFQSELFPLCLSGSGQHGIEDVKVSL